MDERIKSYIKEYVSLEQLRDASRLNIPISKNDIQEIIEELEAEQIHYVDLGLPSGTLWADRNVGAKHPWEYGKYFNFDDAQKQGYLPARWQMCELIDCTQHCICEVEGIKGMRFIGKNDNSIFMPFAGYFDDGSLNCVDCNSYLWSYTPKDDYAYCFSIYSSGNVYPSDYNRCSYDLSVRLIKNK